MTGVLSPRRAACRALALCLLMLAASPFTAPFSTFDLDSLAPWGVSDPAKPKLAGDHVIDTPRLIVGLPALAAPPARLPAPARRPHVLETQHAVLRL